MKPVKHMNASSRPSEVISPESPRDQSRLVSIEELFFGKSPTLSRRLSKGSIKSISAGQPALGMAKSRTDTPGTMLPTAKKKSSLDYLRKQISISSQGMGNNFEMARGKSEMGPYNSH
jgi:hypothetical protein